MTGTERSPRCAGLALGTAPGPPRASPRGCSQPGVRSSALWFPWAGLAASSALQKFCLAVIHATASASHGLSLRSPVPGTAVPSGSQLRADPK